MMGAVVALALPAVAVWQMLRLVRGVPGDRSPCLVAAVAFLLGVGVSSLETFAAVSLGPISNRVFMGLDAVWWSAAAFVCWALQRRSVTQAERPHGEPPESPTTRWARVAFLVVAITSFAVPLVEYLTSPHGQWDAWAIWNQKARFMSRAGEGWTASMAIPWSQPSHPLLVPAAVARLWAYAGSETTVAPALLSAAFGAATVATVIGGLGPRWAHAWVAGAAVSAPFAFSHLVAAQTADLPCGAYIAASMALLWRAVRCGHGEPVPRAALVVAGLLGGCAAWTKNEGLPFLAASGAALAWLLWRQRAATAAIWWAVAAMPFILLVTWFKLLVVPVGPEYAPSSLDELAGRVLSLARHRQVVELVQPHWLRWGGPFAQWSLVVVLCAVGVRALAFRSAVARSTCIALTIMAGSYYATYVVSPMPLAWLVDTTFERLTLQVWPVLVMAACQPLGGGQEISGEG